MSSFSLVPLSLASLVSLSVSLAASPTALLPLSSLSISQSQNLLTSWHLDQSFSRPFEQHQVDGFALSFVVSHETERDSEGERSERLGNCESGKWLVNGGETQHSIAPVSWFKLCQLLRDANAAGGVPLKLVENEPHKEQDTSEQTASDQSRERRRLSVTSLLDRVLGSKALDYSGVRIAQESALMQLGSDGQVSLARGDLEELLILAQLSVFHGDVVVNDSLHVTNGNLTVNGSPVSGAGAIDACSATFLNCEEPFEAGCASGVYSVFPDGFAGSEPFDVYCVMALEELDTSYAGAKTGVVAGGWTLVYRYTFNNYSSFQLSSNYVDPIPSWHQHANWTGATDSADAGVSTDPPLALDETGALDFKLWKTLGTEWAVVSNINSWLVCQPDHGNLLWLSQGSVSCQNVHDASTAKTYGCEGLAPTTFNIHTHGAGLSGDSHFYYFEQEDSTNWPTHDPCGANQPYQVLNQAEPFGAILVRPKANPCDDSVGPMGSCLDYFNAGYESGSYYIKPDGYRKGSMCVFCNMTLEGGGWTLVYRYGFNNYDEFTASSNYVSHIPTWQDHDNWPESYTLEALESKVAPRTEEEFGAMDFGYWKLLGEEFIVASNINSWVRCRPSNESRHTRGSLTELTAGDLQCTNIKDAANSDSTGCGGVAPDSISLNVRGPSLGAASLFYYWDADADANWPTHDPCGLNADNHVMGVERPFGAIYVRQTESPCNSTVGPLATCDEYYAQGFPSGSYNIKPSGYFGAGICVYCEMRDQAGSRGGWTMVYRYSFTNYADFTSGDNHVTYIPSWTDHADWGGSDESALEGFVSTVAPRAADEFGALPYELWALVAQQGQVMVQSSINSWVVCNETEGALSTVSTGALECANIKDSAGASGLGCSGLAPSSVTWSTYGPYLSGPSSLFYYWDGEGSANWPTHDPCGTNKANHDANADDPYGAVFIR